MSAGKHFDAPPSTHEADYVIVGSGSAGAALAYRLSEDGKHTVAVIEYGGTDIGPLIQMPSALSIPMNLSTYNWGFETEPEPHLGGRRLGTARPGAGSTLEFVPSPEIPALQYFDRIEPGSAADLAGILPMDFILEINGANVVNATHERTVSLIKQSQNKLILKVVTVTSATGLNQVASSTINKDTSME